MIRLEDLGKPMTPLPGKETVLPSTHVDLVASLRTLSGLFAAMAAAVDAVPWEDGMFDDLDRAAADQIEVTHAALIRFRLTRDCCGQS